jgi:hypothetical protein
MNALKIEFNVRETDMSVADFLEKYETSVGTVVPRLLRALSLSKTKRKAIYTAVLHDINFEPFQRNVAPLPGKTKERWFLNGELPAELLCIQNALAAVRK